jgi:hypothetical protein
MKKPDRNTVSQLEELPNIGKSIAKDLRLIGIEHPQDLIGKNVFQLYHRLCDIKGQRIDHCVIDVFMSVIDYMEGGEPQPWWAFTEKRKLELNESANNTNQYHN